MFCAMNIIMYTYIIHVHPFPTGNSNSELMLDLYCTERWPASKNGVVFKHGDFTDMKSSAKVFSKLKGMGK